VVLMLDNRVIKRGYGRQFLNSLPDVPVCKAPAAEVQLSIREFFSSNATKSAL